MRACRSGTRSGSRSASCRSRMAIGSRSGRGSKAAWLVRGTTLPLEHGPARRGPSGGPTAAPSRRPPTAAWGPRRLRSSCVRLWRPRRRAASGGCGTIPSGASGRVGGRRGVWSCRRGRLPPGRHGPGLSMCDLPSCGPLRPAPPDGTAQSRMAPRWASPGRPDSRGPRSAATRFGRQRSIRAKGLMPDRGRDGHPGAGQTARSNQDPDRRALAIRGAHGDHERAVNLAARAGAGRRPCPGARSSPRRARTDGALDPVVAGLVRIATLIALGADTPAYQREVNAALGAGASADQVIDVLSRVASIVGIDARDVRGPEARPGPGL